MKKSIERIIALVSVAAMTSAAFAGCGTTDATPEQNTTDAGQTQTDAAAENNDTFVPSLDTEKSVTLDIAGAMANFEALDQVVNDFNEYYPNVEINYEQNDVKALAEYLKNSQYVDIFMTNDSNIRSKDDEAMYVMDQCLDLSKENLDTSGLDQELVNACTVDGKFARVPLAKMMCGMVVNKTLLEKEGLDMPENYEEFLNVCEALKEKGYTPIQASKYRAYSDMILPMAMNILGNDETLVEKVNSGDTSYADSLTDVYGRLGEIIDKGYTSYEVNETYPDDNYDGAILNFFEGDVPFWITNSECYSGMKKRESKSETYSAEPFEYEYVNVPLGDEGCYDYEEPWYGFSVNKDTDEKEYALEFLNFLCREDELNKLAEFKGMPSAAANSSDARFEKALKAENITGRYVLNGDMDLSVTAVICNTANGFGRGDYASVEEAVDAIKNQQ